LRWIRLLHAAAAPVPCGAVSGADILDARAVAGALVDAFGGADKVDRWAGAYMSVGVPPSAVVVRSVSIDPAGRRSRAGARRMHSGREAGYDRFEDGVLYEAEQLMDLDRDELCVDWFRTSPIGNIEQATLIVTTRRQVLSRVEAAALAGVRIESVDCDAGAALRACRYWLHSLHPALDACVAIWVTGIDARAWCMYHDDIEYALEGDAALDLARMSAWAREREPGILLVASDSAGRARCGFDAKEAARVLGCVIARFDPGCCCPSLDPEQPFGGVDGFATAFGLALRGAE